MNELVSDAGLREIGRVVVWSAEVDVVLAGILNDLLGSRRAKLLTGGQNFSWLRDAIKQVVKTAWDGGDKTLLELLEEASRLHGQRDLVVHGLWLPKNLDAYLADEELTEYHTVRPRRWKETLHGELVTYERVQCLADDLHGLSVKLRKWRDDYLPQLEQERARPDWRSTSA